ncbi:MAG: hypothetical protein ABEJ65_11925, partial [bacterium]
NARDNWYHGGKTPGIVSGGDNYDELWGWGGEIIEGTPMDKKVCLPSQAVYSDQTGCNDGDIGYFKMEYIEDESGKVNLLDSGRTTNDNGSADQFDELQLKVEDGSSDFRDMTSSKTEEVIKYANGTIGDTEWLTPGEYFTRDSSGNRLVTSSIDNWEQYRHLYSGFRKGSSRKKININTASKETLMMIPIRSESNFDESTSPNFVTEAMADAIIKR